MRGSRINFFYLGVPARLRRRRFQASLNHARPFLSPRSLLFSAAPSGVPLKWFLASVAIGRMRYAPAYTTMHVRAYRLRLMPKTITATPPNARSFVPQPRFAAHHPIPSSQPFPAPRIPHPYRPTVHRNGIHHRTIPRVGALQSPAGLTACQSPCPRKIWGTGPTPNQPVRAEGLGSPRSERSDTLGCFDPRNNSIP